MRTLIQVPAPTTSNPAQWWPDLYLKKGREMQEIKFEQCEVLANEYRERAMAEGRGGRDTPPIKLYDQEGRLIASICWNGRIQTVEGLFIEA